MYKDMKILAVCPMPINCVYKLKIFPLSRFGQQEQAVGCSIIYLKGPSTLLVLEKTKSGEFLSRETELMEVSVLEPNSGHLFYFILF